MKYDDLIRIAWDAGCAVHTENAGMEIPQSVLNAMALAVAGERAECAKMFVNQPKVALKIQQRVNTQGNV